MKNVEKDFPQKDSKVIPSLSSEGDEGISLMAHNLQVTSEDAEFVEKIFKALGEVKIVNEEEFGLATDLTSCSPAFISFIMMKFVESARKQGTFTQEEAEEMVVKPCTVQLNFSREKSIV
jgi:pyrroline-5-carboxylate reductase